MPTPRRSRDASRTRWREQARPGLTVVHAFLPLQRAPVPAGLAMLRRGDEAKRFRGQSLRRKLEHLSNDLRHAELHSALVFLDPHSFLTTQNKTLTRSRRDCNVGLLRCEQIFRYRPSHASDKMRCAAETIDAIARGMRDAVERKKEEGRRRKETGEEAMHPPLDRIEGRETTCA
jgi:hypothetical protein